METLVGTLEPTASTVTTKRALLVASHAMERAFDADDLGTWSPGLVVGFFQRREYFDIEAERYASLAAHGHTVIVAFTGPVDGLPEGVTAVRLRDDDLRARHWGLSMVRGEFGAALSAADLAQLSPQEATFEASRLFESWTTLRRRRSLETAATSVDALAASLPADVLARARAHLEQSAALPVSAVEDRLARAADHLMRSVEVGHHRATLLRLELEAAQSVAERDQLTGLHNRHFLERFLGDGDRPADLLALLIDVDGLKQVNDDLGHQAGDALLRCVAAVLQSNTRAGDVVVRWGGDEFLLLVPLLEPDAALRYGERLATAIRGGRVDAPWESVRPSASIGVSATRSTSLPIAQLDVALYQVKKHGKGHAALAPAPSGC